MYELPIDPFESDAQSLARLLALADDSRPAYRGDELGSILRHQMQTRIEFDLQNLDPGTQRLLRAAGQLGDRARTFGDLFQDPQPPLQLLNLTKNFAKGHLFNGNSSFPPEIATVLYYCSITAARVRWNRHITWLTDEELRRGISQVLRHAWLDDVSRQLLQEGLAALSPAAVHR